MRTVVVKRWVFDQESCQYWPTDDLRVMTEVEFDMFDDVHDDDLAWDIDLMVPVGCGICTARRFPRH